MLVWNDEFSGTSIDTSKWGFNWPDTMPNTRFFVDVSAYNPSYVTAHDGYAWIKTDATSTVIDGVTLPYQTGFLSTKGKFEFQYGYVETRFRHAASATPSAPEHTGIGGYHAFWMLPHYNDSSSTTSGTPSLHGTDVNGADGRGSEVDITEWGASGTSVNNSEFWGGYGTGGTGFTGPHLTTTNSDPQGWHTYGLEWTPTKLVFYQDGVVTNTISNTNAFISFYPEFLMIQTGIVKWQTTPNNLPDYLQIDYVRCYQLPNVTYQAESQALSGGAGVNTNHTGYTGTGFVDGFAASVGATLTTTVNTSATATKTLTIRYSAGPISGAPTNRVLGLYVNGTKVRDVTFTGTADWNTWANNTQSITLPGGAGNTIAIISEQTGNASGVNIDYIALPNSADVVSGNRVVNAGFDDNAASFGLGANTIADIAGWYVWSPTGSDDDASYLEYGSDYSNGWNAVHYKASNYVVYTGQDITLPNGTYNLSAYVRSSGGQNACYLEAKGFGGSAVHQNVTAESKYRKVSINGIHVTDGKITVGFYSDALSAQWLAFDNVQLLPATGPITVPAT
ncbi:family 16 glycosylhydrolase [Catenulispora acidiphila]|uniref:family 16 glycosylhydrolase n=1 Tax=Catenulispora acidiphila TaxID=304895 RepID=UPI00019E39DA|nr:family 16 glycosylhydrolase [Catenulispora acidiphila]